MGEGLNRSGTSRHHIMMAVEDSLRRLDTDRIDLYYLHRWNALTPIEESLHALDDCVRQGKVRYIGCSNFDAWRLCEAWWTSDRMNLEKFICLQPLYNIVIGTLKLNCCRFARLMTWVWCPIVPLARGVLTGKISSPDNPPPPGSRAARQDRRICKQNCVKKATRSRKNFSRWQRHMVKRWHNLLGWTLANHPLLPLSLVLET